MLKIVKNTLLAPFIIGAIGNLGEVSLKVIFSFVVQLTQHSSPLDDFLCEKIINTDYLISDQKLSKSVYLLPNTFYNVVWPGPPFTKYDHRHT